MYCGVRQQRASVSSRCQFGCSCCVRLFGQARTVTNPPGTAPTQGQRSSRWTSTHQHANTSTQMAWKEPLASDSLTSCGVTQNRPSGCWRGLRLQMHHCLAKGNFQHRGPPCFRQPPFRQTFILTDRFDELASLPLKQLNMGRSNLPRLVILAHIQDLGHSTNQAVRCINVLFA